MRPAAAPLQTGTDACGVLLLITWGLLTLGGIFLPEGSSSSPVYQFLRQICTKPVVGGAAMLTIMPLYAVLRLLRMLITACTTSLHNAIVALWEEPAVKVLATEISRAPMMLLL